MLSVRHVPYFIKVNGDIFGTIQTKRGLRQGDPFSPYLFLFCIEAFGSLIADAEACGVIQGVFVSPFASSIFHLLFADVNTHFL